MSAAEILLKIFLYLYHKCQILPRLWFEKNYEEPKVPNHEILGKVHSFSVAQRQKVITCGTKVLLGHSYLCKNH